MSVFSSLQIYLTPIQIQSVPFWPNVLSKLNNVWTTTNAQLTASVAKVHVEKFAPNSYLQVSEETIKSKKVFVFSTLLNSILKKADLDTFFLFYYINNTTCSSQVPSPNINASNNDHKMQNFTFEYMNLLS